MSTSKGYAFGGIFWRREGSVATDDLRYVADVYQAGGFCAQRIDLTIVSLESIARGSHRIFEVRLFGRVVATKTALRQAKHVAANHLRLELDISFRCLANLCLYYSVRFTKGATYPWGVYAWRQDEAYAAFETEKEARDYASKHNSVAALVWRKDQERAAAEAP